MSDKIGIMVCRDADQSKRHPQAIKGHFCAICGKEVWVTPSGQAHIATLHILCSDCGLATYARLKKEGKALTELISPTALEHAIEIIAREKADKN